MRSVLWTLVLGLLVNSALAEEGDLESNTPSEMTDWVSVEVKPLGDPAAVKGGSLTTSVSDWPRTLRIYGPASNTMLQSQWEGLLYESLLQVNPDTQEYYPRLASHWKISEDQLTYTFRIHPRAHWSDGTPVTAEDVIATFRLLNDPSLGDPGWKEAISGIQEPRKLSKSEVQFSCQEKNWRNFVVLAGMMILPAHEIGNLSGEEYRLKYNDQLTVTTGPYTALTQNIRPNESLMLTRRKQYWGLQEEWAKGLYNFDQIRFLVVSDSRARQSLLQKRELDFASISIAKTWVEELPTWAEVEKGYLVRRKVFNHSPRGFQGLAFNLRRAPLNDVRVRKALAQLYDRTTLIHRFAFGEYTPLKSYFTGIAEHPDNAVVKYDPENAVQLLKEAGWSERGPDGVLRKNGKPLRLRVLYWSPAFEKYLQAFRSNCREVGVDLELQMVTAEILYDQLGERNFDLLSIAWSGNAIPEPRGMWHSQSADNEDSTNVTGFKSKKVDQLIEAYEQEFDPGKRVKLLQQMDQFIFVEHPYILEWGLFCERIVYWNKFGMPETVLPRYSDQRAVFAHWWVDPKQEEKLNEAMRNQSALAPIPEVEVHVDPELSSGD